jgi:hypothetical protein
MRCCGRREAAALFMGPLPGLRWCGQQLLLAQQSRHLRVAAAFLDGRDRLPPHTSPPRWPRETAALDAGRAQPGLLCWSADVHRGRGTFVPRTQGGSHPAWGSTGQSRRRDCPSHPSTAPQRGMASRAERRRQQRAQKKGLPPPPGSTPTPEDLLAGTFASPSMETIKRDGGIVATVRALFARHGLAFAGYYSGIWLGMYAIVWGGLETANVDAIALIHW